MALHGRPNHMMNLRNHVDIHDTGLVDECPRCEEHAIAPFLWLDNRMLIDLIKRADEDAIPRSNNEAIAIQKVQAGLDIARKIYNVYPSIIIRRK